MISFVRFYGLSSIFGYLMPNPVYTYELNIYDLYKYFVDNIFVNEPEVIFCALLNVFFFGFNGISTFVDFFNANAILLEVQ